MSKMIESFFNDQVNHPLFKQVFSSRILVPGQSLQCARFIFYCKNFLIKITTSFSCRGRDSWNPLLQYSNFVSTHKWICYLTILVRESLGGAMSKEFIKRRNICVKNDVHANSNWQNINLYLMILQFQYI